VYQEGKFMQFFKPPETPGVTGKPWGIPAILIGISVPMALWASSLGIAIAGEASTDLSSIEIITSLILTIVVLDGIFLAVPMFVSLRRYRLGWEGLGFRSFDGDKLRMAVMAAAGAWGAVIVYGLLLTLIFGEGAAPEQDVEELFASKAVLPVVGVAVVLAAPFAEEVFFRGFVFPGLIRPIGVFGAIFGSGLLFAMFHVTGPESAGLIIPFTPIGMLFAWLYYKTGTLWTSIAAHLVFNLVSFILLALTVTF
jgi:membrane protease YdiL (CAAX protease family)